jgi:hypothetical protein
MRNWYGAGLKPKFSSRWSVQTENIIFGYSKRGYMFTFAFTLMMADVPPQWPDKKKYHLSKAA